MRLAIPLLIFKNANDELEREIRQLREQQDLRHKIERTTDGYFTLKGENPNIRYCIHCWDAKHLTIQVGEDSTPGSFFCPECNASGVYDKQQFDKSRAETSNHVYCTQEYKSLFRIA